MNLAADTQPSPSRPTQAASAGSAAGSPRYVLVCPTQRGHPDTRRGTPDLAALVDRIPEGWTLVKYEGRRYGLTRTTRVNGRSIGVFANELGGSDLISANMYRTLVADHLRPCEMSDVKVLAFLRGWAPA